MPHTLSTTDLLTRLKKLQGERSMREFAHELDVSVSYLSDVYVGNRGPGPKMLSAIGVEKCEPQYIDLEGNRDESGEDAAGGSRGRGLKKK